MKGYYTPNTSKRRLSVAKSYKCDHPLYDICSLFVKDGLGLAVIQQRFNEERKVSWWGPVDPWILNDIFDSERFNEVFLKHAGPPGDGLYPTMEVRKLMYAVGLKPLKKQYWEMSFRSQIIHLS